MKKLLIAVIVVIGGFYLLGNWATDPETIKDQQEKLGELTQQLNNKMIEMAQDMTDDQVMKIVDQNKQMMKQMIKSAGNDEMKDVFQQKLDAMNKIKSKDDYIQFLKSDS